MTYQHGAISDHGQDDDLPFDLTGWQPVVHGIRSAINLRASSAPIVVDHAAVRCECCDKDSSMGVYKARLAGCLALADKRHTETEMLAIRADQARRVAAMGEG
jgi:inorganic pyrophosphatase